MIPNAFILGKILKVDFVKTVEAKVIIPIKYV